MPKQDVPLKVEIPKPSDEAPSWSRVGVIAAIGFVVGIAWPRIAGVKIGPSAPDDERPKEVASASPAPSPSPSAAAAAALQPAAGPSEAPAAGAGADAAATSNKQLVVVGAGKVARCRDKKNKKIEDCGQLQFDPIALPKLKELATCPSALGLEGKMSIGFEIDFDSKEVQVIKGKGKTSLPNSTVNGILQCAGREFSSVSLDDVAHKHKRYTLYYTAAFYPPGKHPEGDGKPADGDEGAEGSEAGAGSTPSESDASGQATVNWDTALIRKTPKDGDVIARLVRGTKVKLVGRESDWYKVEHGSKTGWVHRAAIGL